MAYNKRENRVYFVADNLLQLCRLILSGCFIRVLVRPKNVNFTQSARVRVSVTIEECNLCKLIVVCCASQARKREFHLTLAITREPYVYLCKLFSTWL